MTLTDLLNEIHRRLGELERRQDGMVTRGKVEEVDTKTGRVRLRLNPDDDEKAFLSPWVPYAQHAGALKVHAPPSKGEQMTLISGAGDYAQGLAVNMTWSDNNKSPSEAPDENVLTFGDVRATIKGNEIAVSVPTLTITCGGVVAKLSAAGFEVTGGQVRHDGKNIGKDHKHNGVEVGGGNTGDPI